MSPKCPPIGNNINPKSVLLFFSLKSSKICGYKGFLKSTTFGKVSVQGIGNCERAVVFLVAEEKDNC